MLLAKQEQDRKDRQQQLDMVEAEAKIKLEAEKNQITALDDKTGHEIDREKLRAETKTSDKGLDQRVASDIMKGVQSQ